MRREAGHVCKMTRLRIAASEKSIERDPIATVQRVLAIKESCKETRISVCGPASLFSRLGLIEFDRPTADERARLRENGKSDKDRMF